MPSWVPPDFRGHTDDADAVRPPRRHNARTTAVRYVALVAAVGLAVVAASRLNIVFAQGVNNRLERACSGPEASYYDRTSWTPLGWCCVVEQSDGTERSVGPWWWAP